MTRVNWLSSAVTVTVLRAWIMPTWIFWLATMMLPREETRRWTVRGTAGRAGTKGKNHCVMRKIVPSSDQSEDR